MIKQLIKLFKKPRGTWIYYYDEGIKRCKCSECLTSYGCFDTPFCPNCGTPMKKGKQK